MPSSAIISSFELFCGFAGKTPISTVACSEGTVLGSGGATGESVLTLFGVGLSEEVIGGVRSRWDRRSRFVNQSVVGKTDYVSV